MKKFILPLYWKVSLATITTKKASSHLESFSFGFINNKIKTHSQRNKASVDEQQQVTKK